MDELIYSQESVFDLVFNNIEDEQEFGQAANANNPEVVDTSGLDPEAQKMAQAVIDEATNKEIDIDDPEILKKSNLMDPKVVLDPIINKPRFTTEYNNQDLNDILPDTQSTEDLTKVNGIAWPLLSVANHDIKPEYIIKMNLYFTEMIPRIYVKLDERARDIFVLQDNPSLSDTINLTIVPAAQNKYRNISMKFKNDGGASNENGFIEFDGYMYCPEFMQKSKNLGIGETQLSTFDLVRKVATMCELGFQCTCISTVSNIPDKEPRVVYNMTLKDFLESQVLKGGRDENELFDLWVDPYYYLTLVDLPYIFNKENDTNQVYTNYTQVGIITSESYFPNPKFKLTYRTLYNIHHGGAQTNLEIASFNIETNNNIIVKQKISEYAVGQEQVLKREDVQTKDGQGGTNDTDIQEKVGTTEAPQMQFRTTNNSQISQKTYRETWLNRRRQTRYKVTMRYPNLGLQRGTFIKLMVMVTKETEKSQILTKISNTSSDGANLKEKLAIIRDEHMPIMDPFTSGVYYIDGIEFEYGKGITIMNQHLYLIKRDETTSRLGASDIIPANFELKRSSTAEDTKNAAKNVGAAIAAVAEGESKPISGTRAAEAQAIVNDDNPIELDEVVVTPQGAYVVDKKYEEAAKAFEDEEDWIDLLGFNK